MRVLITILTTILLSTLFVQCDRNPQMGDQQINEQQMEQMMQNPQMRQGMMQRMANDSMMRREMMAQMRSGMGQMNQEAMLDRMETMMQNPEQRQRMLAHVENLQRMLENEEFDRNQMRQMMEESPMMRMHMQCMQMNRSGMMMGNSDSTDTQGMMNQN